MSITHYIINLTLCQQKKYHFILVDMNVYQKEFIQNLKKYRKENNLSQALLAEKCGVSTGTIGNIECGIASPSFELLLKMAEVLKTHPALLFADQSLFTKPDFKSPERKILEEIYDKIDSYLEEKKSNKT